MSVRCARNTNVSDAGVMDPWSPDADLCVVADECQGGNHREYQGPRPLTRFFPVVIPPAESLVPVTANSAAQ